MNYIHTLEFLHTSPPTSPPTTTKIKQQNHPTTHIPHRPIPTHCLPLTLSTYIITVSPPKQRKGNLTCTFPHPLPTHQLYPSNVDQSTHTRLSRPYQDSSPHWEATGNSPLASYKELSQSNYTNNITPPKFPPRRTNSKEPRALRGLLPLVSLPCRLPSPSNFRR